MILDWPRELAGAAERSSVHEVVPIIVLGGVVETRAARGKGARTLVVGSYGEGAWTRLLAGSAAVTLIDRTTFPIAVIRGSASQTPPPRSAGRRRRYRSALTW